MQDIFPFWKDVPVNSLKSVEIFYEGYFKDKPRPTYNDKEVKLLVVEHVLPEILAWLNDVKDSDNDKEEITKNLLEVIENHEDGYYMAKRLDDDEGWDCDSNLVEILDNLDFYNVKNKLTSMWIKDNNIKPLFKVGDKVRVKSSDIDKDRRSKEFYDGEIIDVNFACGSYTVCIKELGHIQKGTGTHGNSIDWEKIEAVSKGK